MHPETARLLVAIGAVVVAGGHVEWTMQRLLLSLRGHGPDRLAEVTSLTWSQLEKKLLTEADASPRAAEIRAALDQADADNLKTVRDTVVHSYWWLDGQPGIRGNRHPRGESGHIVVGQPDDLLASASKLGAHAARLEALTDTTGWPRIILADPT